MKKILRATTSLLAALALMATAVVVCPCPGGATVEPRTGDHGCCASEGIKAASACCNGASTHPEQTVVPAAAPTLGPCALVPLASAPEAPLQAIAFGAPAPSAFRSPPVLRI